MTEFKTIQLESKDKVTTIWLNRPEVHNALNGDLLNELTNGIKWLKNYKSNIIIIRGKGESFCSGADLNWMKDTGKLNYAKNKKASELIVKVFKAIYTYPMPVITAIHGHAHGGANGIIAASDIAIAAEDAGFSLGETRLGLAPSIVIPFLLTRLNEHQAKNMILRGSKITAKKALEIGLVDDICKYADLEMSLSAITDELKKAVPDALKACKLVFLKANKKRIHKKILQYSIETLTKLKSNEEAQKRLADFLKK